MTDKHQALRDALKAPSFMRYARPELVSALLADHDRMREALQGLLNLLPNVNTLSIKAAREALQECEQ